MRLAVVLGYGFALLWFFPTIFGLVVLLALLGLVQAFVIGLATDGRGGF